jgi:hypothetical protein
MEKQLSVGSVRAFDFEDFVMVVALVPKPRRDGADRRAVNDVTRATVPTHMAGSGYTHGAPDDE